MYITLITIFIMITTVNITIASETQSPELFRSILEKREQLEYFQGPVMQGNPKNIDKITDVGRYSLMDNAFKEYTRNLRQFTTGDPTLTVLDLRNFDFAKDEWLISKIFTHDLTKVCEIKLQDAKNIENFFEKAEECQTFYSLRAIHCEHDGTLSPLVLEFLGKLQITKCIRDMYQEHPKTNDPVATINVYTDDSFESQDIKKDIPMYYKSTNNEYTGILRVVSCR
jgi:hypothetical protein